jgi:hypothetical protein
LERHGDWLIVKFGSHFRRKVGLPAYCI